MTQIKSPLGIAAGLIKSQQHVTPGLPQLVDHITFGSFTLEPRQGNKEPTYWFDRTRNTSINAVGLTNPGLNHFVTQDLPRIWDVHGATCSIRVSLAPLKSGDVSEMLDRHSSDLLIYCDEIEINSACPNHRGGNGALHQVLCHDPDALELLMAEASAYPGSKAIKIAPDMSEESLKTVVGLALRYDFTSIVSGNTRKSSSVIDGEQRLSVDQGGLAGAAIRNAGLAQMRILRFLVGCAYQKWHKDVRLIGCGGVLHATDLNDYLVAGADTVQCATYFAQYGEKGIRDMVSDFFA